MPAGKPNAELQVNAALVRRLLADQHPDLATLPLSHLDSGWDNVIFRLGSTLTVRVPRRQLGAELVANEQTWLPVLAPRLPVPISAPVRVGQPTDYYPWPWSVLPYFEGECADLRPPASGEALRFADFLLALHGPAPLDAPQNPLRGIPLRGRQASTVERMAGLREQNVLVGRDRSIRAVIDWGDVSRGDVATDLAGIWALFELTEDRQRIVEQYNPDRATLARARGWAVVFAVVLADSGLINSPRHAGAGAAILGRLALDAA
ncbi:MAG TPA: phosphotransferase [Pseudomonadales bacterium]